MTVKIIRIQSYDGYNWKWRVSTECDAGFYQTGREETYRKACRASKRAIKKLDGIGWLPYDHCVGEL